jgi:hypothetical protein
MASISEGITVEGEAANSGGDLPQSAFDSMLAEQATKSYDAPATPATPEPRRDLSADSVEDVYRSVLDEPSGGSTRVKDGLSVEVPELSEPPRERLAPADQELVARAQRDLARERQALEVGAEASDRLAVIEAIGHVRAGEGAAALDAFVGLSERSNVLLDQALYDAAVLISGVDEADLEYDEESADDLAETIDVLARQVSEARNERAFIAASERVAQLTTIKEGRDIAAQKSVISTWQSDLGLSADEARARVEAAEAVCPHLFPGVVLADITDQKQFDAVLRACDSTIAEAGSAQRTRQIQQSVLDQPSGNVRDGLEQFTALGWQPIVDQNLDRNFGPPVPTPDRTAARAQRHRSTVEDIRQSVLQSDSASVRDGLTVNGKSVSVDQATGAIEKRQRELEDERARSMGLLR